VAANLDALDLQTAQGVTDGAGHGEEGARHMDHMDRDTLDLATTFPGCPFTDAELEANFRRMSRPQPKRPDPLPPVEDVLPEMVQRIVEDHNPVAVILFGSRARGTAGPDSDTDLLIVLDSVPDKRKARTAIHETLRPFVGYPRDILVTTPDEIEAKRDYPISIIRVATEEGVYLYDRRDPSAGDAGLARLRAS